MAAHPPALAALAFVGCYALGIFAGITSALIARRTVLRGRSRPMALELPTYKTPSLRTAFLTTSTNPLRIQANYDISPLPEDAMQEIRDAITTNIRFNSVVQTGVPGFIPRVS